MTWIFPPLYYPKPRTSYTRNTRCTRANIIASIGIGISNLSNSGVIRPGDMSFQLRTYVFPTKKEQTARIHNARKSLYLLLPESFSQFWPPHKLYTLPIEDLLLIWRNPPKSSYTKRILVAGGDGGASLLRSPLSSSSLKLSALKLSSLKLCSLKVSSLFYCKPVS
ncbi:hypothetical protein EV426DRAFT_395473 [Tirmania nivea]|nr:hypothetical protein EV426DRAFT_395473 [Tirmania nivea]